MGAPTDPDHPPGPDYPADRIPARVRPADLALGFRGAASVLRTAQNHIDELDAADLSLPDGRTVRIVTVSEVEAWINSLARRVAGGEAL